MTVSQQMRWWGAALAVFVLLLWLLSSVLFPFVLGAAIAYLTDPVADWFERRGFGRLTATIFITLGSLGVVVAGLLLIVPLLVEQVRELFAAVPVWLDQARVLLHDFMPELQTDGTVLNQALEKLRDNLQSWSLGLLGSALSGGMALLWFIGILVVTPVVAFYLLMDWDRLMRSIDDNLPRQHRPTILAIARELDSALAGFVRGQATVCLILGTFYAVALMLVGLNFGLLIGIFAGLITFIPYVGSVVGGALSIGIALAQFWGDWVWVGVVAAIFVSGQAVEGNFLTPKLVGGKVGLHPVWLMFALSAFGALFGFIGLLIAVPAAAAIGVIGRFMLEQYRKGPLYRGENVIELHERER